MPKPNIRTLRVAGVQVVSKNGKVAENLEHAAPFVNEAARKGAKLILLPEFLPTGYVFTKEIWDGAEPKYGPTVQWLMALSKKHRAYIGTSFLEAEGEDFFNTFVLAGPDGREAGRVRKQTPAAFEGFFTKGEPGSHMIDTEFGRVGVGICFENMLAFTSGLAVEHSSDIHLMPHSAPAPAANIFFPKAAVGQFLEFLRDAAPTYALALGVPAVFVNKSGDWHSALPGLPFMAQRSSFPGLTSIADSDGTVVKRLGREEGVIVADVTLDPARKTGAAPRCRGVWAMKTHWGFDIWRFAAFAGGIWYTMSAERGKRALAVSRMDGKR